MKTTTINFVRGKNRKIKFLFAVGIVLFLFFIPFYSGLAFNPFSAKDWGGALLNALNFVIRYTLLPFAVAFATLAGHFLDYTVSPAFTNISLTHGPGVDIAWNIARDVANMVFILIFAAMAFGTILGVESYGVRRMLPHLLVAALLINFSKVIAGAIVDLANIIMMFFINSGIYKVTTAGATKQSISTALVHLMGIGNLFGTRFIQDLTGASFGGASLYAFLITMTRVVFIFLAGIIFFVLGLTLVIRIVSLWMVMIFAPLAFAASALPGWGRNFFKGWFSSLVKWATLGIPIVFFLYLAALVGQELTIHQFLPEFAAWKSGALEGQSEFIAAGQPFLMFLLIFLLLFRAYSISKQVSTGTARFVMGQATQLGKKTGRLLIKKPAKGATYQAFRATVRKAEEKGYLEKAEYGLRRTGLPGSILGLKALANKISSEREKVHRELSENEKKFKSLSSPHLQKLVQSRTLASTERLSIAKILAERKAEIPRETIQRLKPLLEKFRGEPRKKVASYAPDVYFNNNVKDMYEFITENNVRASQIAPSSLSNPRVAGIMGRAGIRQIQKERNLEQLRALQKGINDLRANVGNSLDEVSKQMNISKENFQKQAEEMGKLVSRSPLITKEEEERWRAAVGRAEREET